ncbi:MAG: hypothetical protein U0174_05205 [Polyangiaceae bacterium]
MKWLSETYADGALVLRIGRDGDTVLAEWPELGVLRAPRNGVAHTFEPAEGADVLSLQKLERGVVVALLRHLRGELSLHASAVVQGDKAVAFIGESGSGKSTFAAYLGRKGWLTLADDVAHIEQTDEGFFVLPSERTHFLLPDACEALGVRADDGRAKTSVDASQVGERTKLAALVSFADDDCVRVERVKGFATVGLLLPCLARFVFDEPAVLKADLEHLSHMLARVPLYRIGRPRGFEHLAEVEQRMLEVLGA